MANNEASANALKVKKKEQQEREPAIRETVWIKGANRSIGVCTIEVYCPESLTKEDLYKADLAVGELARTLATIVTEKLRPGYVSPF